MKLISVGLYNTINPKEALDLLREGYGYVDETPMKSASMPEQKVDGVYLATFITPSGYVISY